MALRVGLAGLGVRGGTRLCRHWNPDPIENPIGADVPGVTRLMQAFRERGVPTEVVDLMKTSYQSPGCSPAGLSQAMW